jgi:hypothetical protein
MEGESEYEILQLVGKNCYYEKNKYMYGYETLFSGKKSHIHLPEYVVLLEQLSYLDDISS